MEYASFCNLMNKADYLCTIENEALEKKGKVDIENLEVLLNDNKKIYDEVCYQLEKEEQTEKEEMRKSLRELKQEELRETNELEQKIDQRRDETKQRFTEKLEKNFSVQLIKDIYKTLEQGQAKSERELYSEGIPFRIYLSRFWLETTELLKQESIRNSVKEYYSFMLSDEGILLLPGIFAK
ncbi:hypothetical protein P261_02115 [Lachnospiraceae bacterium TWA4]|nr:hypothetical protein P261_02115 [Lachnospiraceae bacterium TWA4]